MNSLFKKKIIILTISANVFVFASFAEATTTSAVLGMGTSTTTTSLSPVGATEVKKAIKAEKTRLVQLKKKLQPTSGIAHTLRKSDSGEEVRLLQKFLKIYGTFSFPVVTGYFGTQTKESVKEFQRRESLDPVGIVGPKTRARILAISNHELMQEVWHMASSTEEIAPRITSAIFSADIGEDGSSVGGAVIFASTTKNIYAILTLANIKQDTEIGVIRYYKDMYVDSFVTHPSRSGLRYTHFQWSLKDGMNRTPGPYTMSFYINGKKMTTATFTII